MDRLQINLFGKPDVLLNGAPVTAFESAKVQALLYYLAVTGKSHSRDRLAALLWGDLSEATARRNLTKALTNLRQLIEPYVLIERHSISFNEMLPAVVDVNIFRAAVEGSLLLSPDDSEAVLTSLRRAVNLYLGEFLEGFNVKHALEYEAWVLEQRESLRALMLQALQILVAQALAQTDVTAGLDYAARLLKLEPWHEAAHRQMMRLLALAGRREAALVQYETCRHILVEELGVEPTAETTALYERLKSATAPPPHNLPPPPNTFVGREVELAQIARHLTNPTCRLVTIVGPGGIGKTRLALQAARRYLQPDTVLLEPDLTDGVYVVSLASITVTQASSGLGDLTGLANTLVSAIADALGFSFHGSGDMRGQLLNHLHGKAMLLVLDNFEQLLAVPEGELNRDVEAGTETISAILQQAPRIRLVITSRERLNLQEEWVVEVTGLAYPGRTAAEPDSSGDDPLAGAGHRLSPVPEQMPVVPSQFSEPSSSAAHLQSYSALTLFTQRAQQTWPGFVLTQVELPHVTRLCQLVEGMPLGLELAASWLRVFTCAEMVTEIEGNLDFLATSLRNVPPRHRSLRAVFEQSWNMLSVREQGLFAQLSVFRGGFGREAASKVARVSPAMLARLVDKSLLRRSENGRYELHELLRQYASEKLWRVGNVVNGDSHPLSESPQAPLAVWQRYSDYYLSFVSQRVKLLRSGRPQQATSAVRLELDNIRQAWQWAVTEGWIAELAAAIDGLSRFYDQCSLFQEGELVFGQAATFLQTHETVLSDGADQAYRTTLVRLWIEQARFLNRRGAAEPALEIMLGAANLAQVLQAPALLAMVAQQQGECLYYLGKYPAAQQQLERALTLAQTAPLPAIINQAQLHLGIVAQYQGHFAESQRWLEQAQQGCQTLDDRRSLSLVLLNLGALAFNQGDHKKARDIFERALEQARAMDDLWIEGMLLNNLGFIAYEEGRHTLAQTTCQQALDITCRLMDRANEAFLLHSLGNIARDQGDYGEADRHYGQCLALSRDLNDRHTESYALADLGLLLHYRGEHAAACDHCRQAMALAEALNVSVTQSLALTHLGHALLAMKLADQAGDAYRLAMALRQECGEHHRAAESQAGLAAALLAQGDISLALAEVEAVLAYLANQPLTGIIEPARVYLTCYRVLQASQDLRATEVLLTAHRLMQARAAAIEDERLRRSYLDNIPAHEAIVGLVSEHRSPSSAA